MRDNLGYVTPGCPRERLIASRHGLGCHALLKARDCRRRPFASPHNQPRNFFCESTVLYLRLCDDPIDAQQLILNLEESDNISATASSLPFGNISTTKCHCLWQTWDSGASRHMCTRV